MSTFSVLSILLIKFCHGGEWSMSGETLFPIMDVGIADPKATYSTELDSSGSWYE